MRIRKSDIRRCNRVSLAYETSMNESDLS